MEDNHLPNNSPHFTRCSTYNKLYIMTMFSSRDALINSEIISTFFNDEYYTYNRTIYVLHIQYNLY